MDFYKDKKFLVLLALFAVLAMSLLIYPRFSGLLLITGLIFFGGLSLIWKEPHIRIAGMVFLVLLSLTTIYFNGLKFGIDFSGGTRIPVVLERPATSAEMSDLISIIKKRVSVMGLTEAKVRAVGENQINVEIPSGDDESIRFIEATLSKQGVYQGIIDGNEGITGDRIFSSSIKAVAPSEIAKQGVDWGVAFSVDKAGADQFAKVAKGKPSYPIYMYLDRPQDAAIFYTRDELRTYVDAYSIKTGGQDDITERELRKALTEALRYDTANITVFVIDDLNSSLVAAHSNVTKAIVSSNLNETAKADLRSRGFVVVGFNESEITPDVWRSSGGNLIINKLQAVGLLSAPLLAPELASGIPSYNYMVSGAVSSTADTATKNRLALEQEKSIESILKGGSLPVQISLGSRTTLPASLGSEFLTMSLVAIACSLVFISIFIGLRYRNLSATLPIVLISLGEFVILIGILGSFTIDLAAMAGIIAAIGVGVDAQIVITDELLKKEKKEEEHSTHEKVELAFGIIKTNAIVAIFSMVPLLFSGLVEVIGFSISTILGALLGYMLTRPTYAALVERTIENEKKTTASSSSKSTSS